MSVENRILVVTDDLTGANAAGAAFHRDNRRAVSVTANQRSAFAEPFWDRFDVAVVNTASRHAMPEEASSAVTAAIEEWWPADLVSKRIDTTLRGNIGVELEAAIETCTALSGTPTVALVVPAHPAAGRTTHSGRQLLNGEPIDATETARDVRAPVTTADVGAVVTRDTGLIAANIEAPSHNQAAGRTYEALIAGINGGADVLICDAESEDDLESIATAAAAILSELPPMHWLAVDPGPFTVKLASAFRIPRLSSLRPLLVVSGSPTELSRMQVRRFIAERHPQVVEVRCDEQGRLPSIEATVAELQAALAHAAPNGAVLLGSALEAGDVVTAAAGAAPFASFLARVASAAITGSPVSGLYLSGGDVGGAVLAELGACGLAVTDEIVPLAVSGRLVGGPWHGLPVVTKGGLVGESDAVVACVDHLRRAPNDEQSPGASAPPTHSQFQLRRK